MLVNYNTIESTPITTALNELEYRVLYLTAAGENTVQQIAEANPDIVVVDTSAPHEKLLQTVNEISQQSPRPIVMFSEQGDSDTIAQATQAGVSAYVLNNTQNHRIQSILDAAVARFKEMQALKLELNETRSKLDERKTIDRAKGLLMSKRALSENEAYRLLQTKAMEQNKKIGEVAKNIIAMAELIG